MKKRKRIQVNGRVQGVGYRLAAAELARSLSLTGMIHNEPNGSVMVEAEGEESELATFVAWCRKGPLGAAVAELVEEELPLQGDLSFEITRAPYQADVD